MGSTKQNRLLTAFNYLKTNGIAHTQRDVAARMMMQASNLSSAFNGNERILTDGFLMRFNSAYDNMFRIQWLLEGEGEMLAQSEHPPLSTAQNPNCASQHNSILEQIEKTNNLLEKALDSLTKAIENNERQATQYTDIIKNLLNGHACEGLQKLQL